MSECRGCRTPTAGDWCEPCGRKYLAAIAAVDRAMVRCELCLGMGYKGRWRHTKRGKAWRLERCRRCDGRGQVEERKP